MAVFKQYCDSLPNLARFVHALATVVLTLLMLHSIAPMRIIAQERSITLDDHVAQLVADGSDQAVRSLEVLFRSGDDNAFDAAARGIVRIAEQRLVNGQRESAYTMANNIWLSSSPNDARQDAWRVIFLCDPAPRLLVKGHQVIIEAPGGRDHRRFSSWLTERYLQQYAWIVDLQISYYPMMVEAERASETARITFVLDDAAHKAALLHELAKPGQTFRTDQWWIVSHTPLIGLIGVNDRDR